MWRVGGGGSRNTGKGRKVVYRRLKTEEGAIKEGAGTGSEDTGSPLPPPHKLQYSPYQQKGEQL